MPGLRSHRWLHSWSPGAAGECPHTRWPSLQSALLHTVLLPLLSKGTRYDVARFVTCPGSHTRVCIHSIQAGLNSHRRLDLVFISFPLHTGEPFWASVYPALLCCGVRLKGGLQVGKTLDKRQVAQQGSEVARGVPEAGVRWAVMSFAFYVVNIEMIHPLG